MGMTATTDLVLSVMMMMVMVIIRINCNANKINKIILYFKLSPCSEYCTLISGRFPDV
jgi:hypothetical protein